MRKLISVFLVLILAMGMSACFPGKGNNATTSSGATPETVEIATADISNMDFTFSKRDKDSSYESVAAEIKLKDNTAEINGSGAELKGSQLIINAAGTYVLAGKAADIMVKVEVGDEDKVQLVLNGVEIRNSAGPAIYVKAGDKVFITLAEGTANSLLDGVNYSITDDDTTIDAAVFSRSDLTINGSGSLLVYGNYKHGIVSKDDLIITCADLEIQSAKVSLCGKDCVKIGESNVSIKAFSDGIRSDNTEDTNRGFVYIDGAHLDIEAANDGVQAETVVMIQSGYLDIGAGGDAAVSYDSESMKGIKAGSDIIINGGNIFVNSADDAIHSNNTISISDGILNLVSNDDGIHADTDLSVSGGSISVGKSYEGLEAAKIVISGGRIGITASDDGLNAAGGNDSSSMGGRPGQGNFSSMVGEIYITGGYTVIDASGDGVDSNGTLSVSGGVTLVSGPTNNGNGAFDYGSSASVSGGVLVALGTVGMAQGFTSAEGQGAILCSFSTQAGGTNLALVNSEGEVVVSFTPAKAYQSAVITAPGIQQGENYTLVAGGTVADADLNGYAQNSAISGGTTLLTIEMTANIYGSSGGMGPGGMQPGGMQPGGMQPGGPPPQGMQPGRR